MGLYLVDEGGRISIPFKLKSNNDFITKTLTHTHVYLVKFDILSLLIIARYYSPKISQTIAGDDFL